MRTGLFPKLNTVGKRQEILNFVMDSAPRLSIAASIFIQKLVPSSFVFIDRTLVQMQRQSRAVRYHVDGVCLTGPLQGTTTT